MAHWPCGLAKQKAPPKLPTVDAFLPWRRASYFYPTLVNKSNAQSNGTFVILLTTGPMCHKFCTKLQIIQRKEEVIFSRLPNIIHREMVLRACILALVATSAHGTNDAWKEISSQLEAEQAHTVAASSVVRSLC